MVVVEVDERPDRLVRLLGEAGLTVRAVGRLIEVGLHDDTTYDVVRDTVVGAGLGLVRMERRRHRMAEIFATARAAGGADAA